MKAMILAAGFGTRLLPYTNVRPKPLFPILGRPLLCLIIDRLRQNGFSSIVVNTCHLGHQIVELLKDEKDILLQEEEIILGTGGGLRMALDAFAGGPVLVVNADLYHSMDYRSIYQRHVESQNRITMVMHDYGRFNKVRVAKNGKIIAFSEKAGCASSDTELLAFTGVHVVDSDVLASIPPGRFVNIIDHYTDFIEAGGTVQTIRVDDLSWRDIGTPADYLDLHCSLLQKGEGTSHLKPLCQGRFFADRDVKIGKNVGLSDWGMIGAGAVIGDNACLERVVVWDGAVVEKGAVHKDKIII